MEEAHGARSAAMCSTSRQAAEQPLSLRSLTHYRPQIATWDSETVRQGFLLLCIGSAPPNVVLV